MYRLTLSIEKLDEGGFLGTCSDLPGFLVQGSSPEEVLHLAPEVAADFIAVLRETGRPLPPEIKLDTTPAELAVYVPA